MKKVLAVALLSAGFAVGCGPTYDESESAPVPTEEQTGQEIEKAMESGEIDPATYGKE